MTAPATLPSGGRVMGRVAALLGCTEGQAYTALVGIVVTVAAVSLGIPPTIRDRVAPSRSGVEAASPDRSVGGANARPPAAASGEEAPPAVPGAALPLPAGPTAGSSGAVSGSSSDTAADPSPSTGPAPATGPSPTAGVTAFGAARVAAKVGSPGAPEGVAVDDAGRLYVATNNGLRRGDVGASAVLRYSPGGRVERTVRIAGQSTARADGLTGLALTDDGHALVLDTAPARVLRVDLDAGRQETVAQLPDLPACGLVGSADACESGAADESPLPRAVVIDASGAAFVSDTAQGVIWRIAEGGKAVPWYRFEEPLGGPAGLTIDDAGDLVVVVTAPGTGRLDRIDVRRDGAAGARSTVAELDGLGGAIGVASAAGGTLVVTLAAANEILLLAPDGSELDRMTADEVSQQSGVPLDGPTGVVVRSGTVHVTNQSPMSDDASHWAVLSVGLA